VTAASSAPFALACTAYLLAVASPGPSTMAIMATAMQSGRREALTLAAGVVTGSCFWGLTAALGLSAVLATWGAALTVLKLLGGAYLLWLAFKSARSAWRGAAPAAESAPAQAADGQPAPRWYLRGAGLHLTNPKSVFGWLAIVSVGLPPSAPLAAALQLVGTCVVIGAMVFGGYALAFSTGTARRIWKAAHRWLNGALALVFGYAGLRLWGWHASS
jgi:threonine/homoserine/homoserine lactone efflux protein